jgi:hypothetical protein
MSMVFTALLFSLTVQAPPAQSAPPPSTTPVAVIGCLASSTANGRQQFTLTTRDTNRTSPDIKTLTYQLNPTGNVDLKSKVGQRVEVTGTQSHVGVEETESADSHATEEPAGTSGRTPTVDTHSRTDIVVRQLNVTAVKAVAGTCRVP